MKHKPQPIGHKTIERDGEKIIVRCYAPHDAWLGAHTWPIQRRVIRGSIVGVTGGKGIPILQAFQPKVYR